MTPYFQRDGVTLYHGDCREVMPLLSSVDVVLTDPPWVTSSGSVKIKGNGVAKTYNDSNSLKYGKVGYFEPQLLKDCEAKASNDCFFLCGYKELATVIQTVDTYRGVFVWKKPNAPPAAFYPAKLDCSFIVWSAKKSLLYGHQHWASMVFEVNFPSAGCMKTERVINRDKQAVHPCQGPVELYSRILSPFEEGLTVLDPWCGTGTCLVAARDKGLKAIGCEIEERYCEIAANRLRQGVLDFG